MSSRSEVYNRAKSAIVTGEWPPGTLLSEAVVGRDLGVSRTPVHAAFVRLEAEGLVELRPRQGAVVSPIRPQDRRDLIDVRRSLETIAAERILSDRGRFQSLFDELDAVVSEQERADADSDEESFSRADERFHQLIVERSGNSVALEAFDMISDRQIRLRRLALASSVTDRSSLIDDHRALLGHLRGGDLAGFGDILRSHLERQLVQPA